MQIRREMNDEHRTKAELIAELRDLRLRNQQLELEVCEWHGQQTFFESVLESVDAPLMVIDSSDYSVKLANSAAVQFGKLTKDAKCHELTHDNPRPCRKDDHPCPLEMVRDTGKPAVVEHRHRASDGTPRYLEVHGYPVFNSTGELIQLIEYMTDVTERRRAKEELLIRDEIAGIFLTSPDEDMYSDVLSVILKALQSKYGIFGYIGKDGALVCPSMTRNVWEQCRTTDKTIVFPRERWEGIWGRALTEKKTLISNQSFEVPEGHIPMNRALDVPVIHHGQIIGNLLVANKATDYDNRDRELLETIANKIAPILHARLQRDSRENERQAAEQRILTMNQQLDRRVQERTAELETSNRELESFAYSVSHDLRAPLRAIDGFSQALLEEYHTKLDAKGREYLDRVSNAARRMAQLIDDLLKLSRVTRTKMRREPVNLSEMVNEVVQEIRKAQPERDITMVIDEGVESWGDPPLLRLALENLLDNAFKFTSRQAKARIEFGVREKDDHTAFFVKDDGVGFDLAYAGKLFTPFQRLHSRAEFPGTGIGLATVQRIVHRHGGRVWAEGQVDRGATFYFTLLQRKDER